MRASMTSAIACEKLPKVRVRGSAQGGQQRGNAGDLVATRDRVAEEHLQDARVRAVQAEVAGRVLGVRRRDQRDPASLRSVAGLPSSAARGMAFHGRQKSQ